jgi:hypothetical protein
MGEININNNPAKIKISGKFSLKTCLASWKKRPKYLTRIIKTKSTEVSRQEKMMTDELDNRIKGSVPK